MEVKNKILFVSPDASRTGAPKTLLLFIKWLRKNYPEIETTLMLLRDGELRQEFEDVVNEIIIWQKYNTNPILKRINLKIRRWRLNLLLQKKSFSIIYCNSVNTVSFGINLKRKLFNASLVAHIHELKTVIELMDDKFRENSSEIDVFLSASKMVENCLVTEYGIPGTKVRTVYEFSSLPTNLKQKRVEGKLHIGASGTFHWRKGGDLFIQIVNYIKKNNPEIDFHFTWVGALPYRERIIAENDIGKLNLAKHITFTGICEKPEAFFRNFDVFILPSREDPFPLVCVEIGMMGIPIICFDQATGITEVLKEGGGFIVPYLDIKAMAEKIVEYYLSKEIWEVHRMQGPKLFSKFTPENICPNIFKIIQEV